jgi:hypothetical protein
MILQPFLISVHLPCEFCKGTGRVQSAGPGADPVGYPCKTCNETGFSKSAKPLTIDKFKEALGLK